MTVGLLVIRIGLGLLLIGHGAQKLFGWFGGPGLAGAGAFFESVGYRPGRRMAALAGLAEVTAGGLLALGLLTPLGAAIAVGVMLAAAVVHAPNGLWSTGGGYELPASYALTATGLAFTGPGRISVDHLLGLTWSWPYGVGAIALGVITALSVIALRQRPLAMSKRRSDRWRSPMPPTPVVT
ncbi:MAG: putative oxidoreductase [Pseudonocardiales bacterium]|nr:putative oxidoreductase [Pseudonocardiales bacterium]